MFKLQVLLNRSKRLNSLENEIAKLIISIANSEPSIEVYNQAIQRISELVITSATESREEMDERMKDAKKDIRRLEALIQSDGEDG